MVCRALFLQCILYAVYILQSCHLSSTSQYLINSINTGRRYYYIRSNKISHGLMNQFHLIALDVNSVKYPWFSPCIWRNRVMFERRSLDFKTILVPLVRAGSKFLCCYDNHFWRHGVDWDCDVIADADNGLVKCIGSEIYAWNVCFDSRLILAYCPDYFILYFMKQIKNGCPCIL